MAFRAETLVNWCAELGTVLANDEIEDGLSERGGHPVEQKKMMQWSLRITAYAQRLIDDLDALDWTEAIKEQQRNWIGRSQGASIRFEVVSDELAWADKLDNEVFRPRPIPLLVHTHNYIHSLIHTLTLPLTDHSHTPPLS